MTAPNRDYTNIVDVFASDNTARQATPHVGLTGKARSGKDAAAAALVADGYQRIGFADALKNMAYDIDPTVRLNTYDTAPHTMRLAALVDTFGWDRAKSHDDVRRFLQRLGTEGVRHHVGDTVWIDLAMRAASVPSVFTDVRYPNEADAIRDTGGLIVAIARPNINPVTDHVSETAMDGYPVDATIVNDGTLEGLAAKIRAVVPQ